MNHFRFSQLILIVLIFLNAPRFNSLFCQCPQDFYIHATDTGWSGNCASWETKYGQANQTVFPYSCLSLTNFVARDEVFIRVHSDSVKNYIVVSGTFPVNIMFLSNDCNSILFNHCAGPTNQILADNFETGTDFTIAVTTMDTAQYPSVCVQAINSNATVANLTWITGTTDPSNPTPKSPIYLEWPSLKEAKTIEPNRAYKLQRSHD